MGRCLAEPRIASVVRVDANGRLTFASSALPESAWPIRGPFSESVGSLSPPPSEDLFSRPLGSSVNPDTLSAIGPTGTANQQTAPHSSGIDTEIHYQLDPQPILSEFLDEVLKGKIKRRISGSDAVELAQKDTTI
jgi:hypothetical protein